MCKKTKMSRTRKVLWGLLGLLLVGVLVLALAWYNRYSLLETQVQKALDKRGIAAQFNITSADKHHMVIDDITMSAKGADIFSASSLALEYDVKRAFKGEFKRIVVRKPVLNIVLDEHGNIVGDYVPQSSAGAGFTFPVNGIVVEEGLVVWQTAFGHGRTKLSAEIVSAQNWNVVYNSPNTQLSQNGVALALDFAGGVEQSEDNKFTAFGTMFAPNLDTPVLQTGEAKTDYRFDIHRKNADILDVSGWLNIDAQDMDIAQYTANNVKLRLDIKTPFNTMHRNFETFDAGWTLRGDNISVKDTDQRQQLVDKLTARDAMSKAPIAMHFSHILPQELAVLLDAFSAEGKGRFSSNPSGYEVHLTDRFSVKNAHQTVHIPSQENATIRYDKRAQKLHFDANMDWRGAWPLQINNLKLEALSATGFRIDAMQRFSANIITNTAWKLRTNGEDFRLAPMDIDLDYTDIGSVRHVVMSGNLDYDGLVPEGRVQNLRAGGRMKIRMQNNDFTLGFSSASNVHMDTFISQSGWRADGVDFEMNDTKNLIQSRVNGRELQAVLLGVTAQIISPEQDRHLQMSLDKIQVRSVLTDIPLVWNMNITGADIRSDDFPSPGTHIRAANSQLTVTQSLDGALYFKAKNPDTFIETDNVLVEHIEIDMEGTPEDIYARYNTPRVKFKGGDMPALPFSGTARLLDGVLTGNASANLALADGMAVGENTKADILFRSVDGQGTVEINIPALDFTPRGLQPQYFVPSLRGKIADVSGRVAANLHFSFGGDGPIQSYGTTDLINLNIGTLVGPISGINAKLKFSSIFPLTSDGVQMATVTGFDPGFPLNNGEVRFEMIPDGVRIDEAVWPIANKSAATDNEAGRLFIAPMQWMFGNVENTAIVHIENLDLETLLEDIGKDKLSVTGKISGVLPAKIKGVDVRIAQGKLEVKDGGIIQFKTPETGLAAERNELAGYALKALENLTYQKLEMRINGPLDGSVNLDMVIDGKNAEVLSGQPFLFNVGVEGELGNIVRNLSKSFSTQENIKRIMELHSGESE